MHCSKLTGLIGKSILLLILVEWLFQAGVKIVKKYYCLTITCVILLTYMNWILSIFSVFTTLDNINSSKHVTSFKQSSAIT